MKKILVLLLVVLVVGPPMGPDALAQQVREEVRVPSLGAAPQPYAYGVPASGATATALAWVSATNSTPAPAPGAAGFGLAWAVMVLLILALMYSLVAALLAALGRGVPAPPARLGLLVPVLSLVGLGVAIYLTYVETGNVAAVCGPVGDCNAVQASPFAKLFGVLPVGLLGALGYVAILAAWALGRLGSDRLALVGGLALFSMALFGVLFSVYLTFLELFVIKAVCLWCLSSAVIMAVLLVLSVRSALDALDVG